jgi:hypothetical protein
MAASSADIITRLENSATAAFNLSNKFFKIIQSVPSASLEYTDFAEQIFSISISLDSLGQVVPSLNLQDGSRALEDLTKLLDLLDDALADSKEALPHRMFDFPDDVELVLPFEIDNLLEQIEGLCVSSNLMQFVLQLGASEKTPSECQHSPVPAVSSGRLAEGFVNQTRRMVRNLKLSQPRDSVIGRRGVVLRRAKAHAAVTNYLDHMLRDIPDEVLPKETTSDGQAKADDSTKSDKEPIDEWDRVNSIKFDDVNGNPLPEGMPAHLRHNPDQVYAKLSKKDVDQKSLEFYGLPWSVLKDDANYFIVWKQMELWECNNLYNHTRRLRISEEHASLDAKSVIDRLLKKWVDVESADFASPPTQDDDFRRFEKELQELVIREETPLERVQTRRHYMDDGLSRPRPTYIRERSLSRPAPYIRERSFSPPRPRVRPSRRLPPPRRYNSFNAEAKTEYWRPWGNQTAQLLSSLKFRGWQPVYMRGTDAGQTWFYGPEVVHIRRFQDDYTPQEGPMKDGSDTEDYLVISTEWIEEEALARIGFQYQVLPSGFYSLDPRITWGDIELLLGATSTFREERLFRKYRTLPKGDLHESRQVVVPHVDFLHGPKLDIRPKMKVPAPRSTGPNLPFNSPVQELFRDSDDTFTDNFVEVSNRM